MISVINLFSLDEVARVRALVEDAPPTAWQDGKETAGALIRHKKSNTQMRDAHEEISKIFHTSIARNDVFTALTMPNAISKPMISRYRDSDEYGFHIDTGHMGRGERRDVAMSVMLSDPRSYEGGELVFNFGSMRSGLKPEAGQAVLFPAQLEHAIRPVKGERLVLIAWVMSSISDPLDREIVYRLTRAMELLLSDLPQDRDEVVSALAFSRENLVRKWSS